MNDKLVNEPVGFPPVMDEGCYDEADCLMVSLLREEYLYTVRSQVWLEPPAGPWIKNVEQFVGTLQVSRFTVIQRNDINHDPASL